MVDVFVTACFLAMELIPILNRCHRFQGFVYQHARFSPGQREFEVSVRRRKGSAAICSRCHQAAPGYDQLAKRRFELIPSSSCTSRGEWNCRRCGAVVVEEVPCGEEQGEPMAVFIAGQL